MGALALWLAASAAEPSGPHNTPDGGGMWQQANTAVAQKCKLTVIKEVLTMQLPPEAYEDPALAAAMHAGYEKCLKINKVMI